MANEATAPVTTDKNLVPEQGITIQNIVVRPIQRHSADIDKWRSALKTAEMIMGSRVLLYDMYDDIMKDGVLKRYVGKRILGVTKNRLAYINADKTEDEATTKLFKTDQGRYLRKEVQKQKAWGISVIELGKEAEGLKVYSVPRKNIKPKAGLITHEQYEYEDSKGYNYRNPPYNRTVLEVGRYDDLGYILEACPYVIYKRGGFGDWAEFAQVFGMPFREARYDGYNEAVRQQLITALESAGSAGYAVLPREAELTFHEAKNAQGNGELFDLLRKACNEEMAILILGQAATTQQTPGKLGNDDTQEQTEDDINLDDREDEIAIFNEKVKPILINLGFKLDPNGQFVHKPEEEKVKPGDFVNMAKNAKTGLGLPIDDDQVYEVTGLRKPADYNKQKEAAQQQKEAQNNPPPNTPKPPKDKKKDKTNLSFKDRMLLAMADFFAPAPKN